MSVTMKNAIEQFKFVLFAAVVATVPLMGGQAIAQETPAIQSGSSEAAPVAPAPIAPTAPAESTVPAAPVTGTPAEVTPLQTVPTDTVVQAEERDQTLPHDLSPVGMFLAADVIVKAVMIGLALASLLTWTIWIAKSLELAVARGKLKKAMKIIGHSGSLAEAARSLADEKSPAAILVHAAQDEVEASSPAIVLAGSEGLKERVASRLSRIEAAAGRRLSKGTGSLATIGSVAPFVGLFGTVWGIMNSFISISESQTTNLAVVAPGIAEALLATAIGLVAAIPAVVIYNVFARSISNYRQVLADAGAGVERLVSRDIDFAMAKRRSQMAKPAVAAE